MVAFMPQGVQRRGQTIKANRVQDMLSMPLCPSGQREALLSVGRDVRLF